MHNLLPILLLVGFAIVRAIAGASKKSGGSPRPAPPRPGPTDESELERRRRFMEAVGLPVDTPQPPGVKPRTAANPPPLLPVKPPGIRIQVPGTPGRLQRIPSPAPSPAAPVRRSIAVLPAEPPAATAPPPTQMETMASIVQSFTAASTLLKKTAAAAPAAPDTKFSPPGAALLLRLREPASVREAIVLREVLGPPKALQPR